MRAPRIFPLLWALVFPFIDERTREKVYVSGGNDYMVGLLLSLKVGTVNCEIHIVPLHAVLAQG